MADQPTCVNRAGLDIIHFQPGVAFKGRFRSVPCGKHPEDVLDSRSASFLFTLDFSMKDSISLFLERTNPSSL